MKTTTISDLRRAIDDANLEPHAEVQFHNGEDSMPVMGVERSRDVLMIHAGESDKQEQIDALTECSTKADEKLRELKSFLEAIEGDATAKEVGDILSEVEATISLLEP